ncbi:MAG: hypothetical protein WCK90_02300 [archaeon]
MAKWEWSTLPSEPNFRARIIDEARQYLEKKMGLVHLDLSERMYLRQIGEKFVEFREGGICRTNCRFFALNVAGHYLVQRGLVKTWMEFDELVSLDIHGKSHSLSMETLDAWKESNVVQSSSYRNF